MPPTIHKLADLTPEERLTIERKQFEELVPYMQAQYVCWQLECDIIWGDSPESVERQTFDLHFDRRNSQETLWKEVEGFPIVEYEWASLITSEFAPPEEARMTMHPNLIDAYVAMVIKHVNEVRGDVKRLALQQAKAATKLERTKEGEKQREQSRSPQWPGDKPIRERSPLRCEKGSSKDVAPDIPPSCKILSGTQLYNCFTDRNIFYRINPQELDEAALDRVLDRAGLTQQNFREFIEHIVDYLFIPIVDPCYAHAILVGLAPKQKYAFFLDSTDHFEQTRWWSTGLMAIIHKLDPTVKFTKLNKPVVDRTKYWYLFGQYPRRTRTTDSSPDGPQQCDGANCGIFAVTSAFCLAFGYSLLCWEQSVIPGRGTDLDKWKKARVVWELETEEFSSENDFDYDLLEIPQDEITPLFRPNDGSDSEFSASDGESLHPYDDLTPGNEVPIDEDEDEDEDEEEEDDGMDEAFGIKNLDVELGYITDEGEEGSDGEVDEYTEAGEGRAFLTVNHISARLNELKPMSDDLPWPDQMPQEPKGYFNRSGFIYPAPDVNFQPELKYSKRELKKACREFPIYGWKRWSRRSQPLFLQWMLNEMAASIALIRRDAIEPMDHLVRHPKGDHLYG